MLQLRPLRLLVAAAAAACAACSHQNGNLEGNYAEPGGATLRLAADRYEFCANKACTTGALEVRPVDDRSGRVSFFGTPVGAFFRERQARDGHVRTWGEGVETNYTVERSGDASIEIDSARGLYFKRR